jgi:hypothetical protein
MGPREKSLIMITMLLNLNLAVLPRWKVMRIGRESWVIRWIWGISVWSRFTIFTKPLGLSYVVFRISFSRYARCKWLMGRNRGKMSLGNPRSFLVVCPYQSWRMYSILIEKGWVVDHTSDIQMDQAHFSTSKSGVPKQTTFQSVRLLPLTGEKLADIRLPWRYDGFRAWW